MTKRRPGILSDRLLFCLLGGALGVGVIVACDTDNGGTAHGPDLGELPEVDGGRKRLPDGALVEADGAPVVGDDDDDVTEGGSSGCPAGGTAALVAGSDGALMGAARSKGGSWKTAAISGGAAKSKPALVAVGSGFLGATRGAGDVLQSFELAGGAWSAATKIGGDGVKGPPALAVASAKAHVVYSAGPGSNTDYLHGVHDGTKWDAANERVGTTGTDFSYGGVSAGLAALGDNVYFAQNGEDNGLYVRPFLGGWQAPISLMGAGTIGTGEGVTATPEVVALKGKYDLVILYAYKNPNAIAYATHEPGGTPEWGNPDTKFVSGALSGEKFNAAALSDTTLALTFRGDDGNAYYAIGTATTTPENPIDWTAPAPVGGALTAVDTAPAVAKGDCGADALFAFAAGGKVKVTSLKGTTFTPAEEVPNLSGPNLALATK